MYPLQALLAAIRDTLNEWSGISAANLLYANPRAAILCMAVLLAVGLLLLLLRSGSSRVASGRRLVLPALLPSVRPSSLAMLRHLPVLMFASGVPLLAIALADPYTAFVRQDASYPGRRIAVMIDASTSMNQPFVSERFNRAGGPTYFATVAAAEYFMRLRMEGSYRDLISLIEFGNEAYVLTPFTTDYENILLSMRLIAEPTEWDRFPDQGTTIIRAVERGTQLFEAFDFLEASGNLMVIFSDGQDSQTIMQGKPIEEIMAEARKHRIPVYMIRMAFNKSIGDVLPDELWQRAVEQTGGRFYPAADEATILRAVHEIDQLEPGRIDLREYTARQPRFSGYVLAAVALWSMAALMKLGFRQFRTFP